MCNCDICDKGDKVPLPEGVKLERLASYAREALAIELHHNSRKRGWDSMMLREFLERLSDEVRELENSIERFDHGASAEVVIHEAADVMAFAAFIMHRVRIEGFRRGTT